MIMNVLCMEKILKTLQRDTEVLLMYKALLIIIFLWNALKKSTDTESAPTLLNLGMIKSGHYQFGTTT